MTLALEWKCLLCTERFTTQVGVNESYLGAGIKFVKVCFVCRRQNNTQILKAVMSLTLSK